ncbi:MAG: hypothetical protein ACRYG7_21555 [Janthinobacterium lividum]
MSVLNWGAAFLEAYAQLPSAQQQAIISVMLTTSLHPVDLARAQELPFASFFNKPLTQEKLRPYWYSTLPSSGRSSVYLSGKKTSVLRAALHLGLLRTDVA